MKIDSNIWVLVQRHVTGNAEVATLDGTASGQLTAGPGNGVDVKADARRSFGRQYAGGLRAILDP